MKEAAIATFALGAALKVTVVFAVVALLLAVLRRAPASFRHLAGSLTLAGALALPFLGLAVPSWELALLPAPVPAAEPAPLAVASDESKYEAVEAGREGDETPAAEPAVVEQFGYGMAVTAETEPPPPPSSRIPWTPIALTIWAAGAAFLLARLGVGIVRMRRLLASSEPASDEMVAYAREAAESLGIESQAAVLVSDETRVAITAGLRRPVLVLPREAAKWSPERTRLVLMHELAHVVRRDWAALIAVEVAVALYWFHPLAWALARQTRRDGERAADDLVLTAGTKPSVYAGHLLAIVRSLKADPAAEPLPAMGAARPTQFEARLRAMLSGAVSHRALGAPQARLAAITLAAAIVTVAALSPWGKAANAAISNAEGSAVLASFDASDADDASSESTEAKSECKSKQKEKSQAATVSAELATPEPEEVDGEESPEASDTPEPSFVYAIAPEPPASTPMPTGFVQASKHKQKSKGNDDHYDIGMSHHRDGDYDEAIQEFQRSIDEGYKPAASAYNIACGYALKGDADQAFTWLKKSALLGFEVYPYAKNDDDFDGIHQDPRWRQLSKMAREWEQEGERVRGQEAERRFADMTSNPSTTGQDLYDTGMELHHAGRYDTAAKSWQAAAAKGYRPGTSYYNVACAYSLAGDTDRSLQFLRKGVEEGFDSVDAIARQDEDLDNIRTDPRFPAILQMAKSLQLAPWGGKYKGKTVKWDWDGEEGWGESAKEYEAYANANPQIGRAWFNLGFAKLKTDEPRGAIAAFHKALDQNYRRGTTMYNLACAYARDNQKDAAFSWLNKAMDAGFNPHGMMRGDDDLDNLRTDPRYAALQRRARNIENDEKDED